MDKYKENVKVPKICIIGAGFSGLCAGIQLRKQLDIDNFVIFDENHDIGGTWLVNEYPGCACDVPSHLYSFSFEPNPNWSKVYSGQREIWEYMKKVTDKHNLYPNIKLLHKVISCKWDETIRKWQILVLNKTNQQETCHSFDIMIGGIGGLRVPNCPPQFDSFKGAKMHSARWDYSVDLKGKTVGVVGAGASAIQIIPEVVDQAKRLIVYQRKPAWVVPKMQFEFPEFVKWIFNRIPGVQFFLRNAIFWYSELNHSAFKVDTFMSKVATKYAKSHLMRQISNPTLRAKLTPDYPFGCKRTLPSSDYYPALCKPNVTVITSPIAEVTEDSIINEDGTVEKPDVIILATGYKIQEYFAPLRVYGKGGEDILESWKTLGPELYAGIVSSNSPNGFVLLGPNTGIGHNSVLFCIECQVNFTIKVIQEMMRRNANTVTVKGSSQEEYMTNLMKNMKTTVWGTTDCGSWYANHNGVITTLWPDTLVSYYNFTKSVDFSHFDFE